MSSLKLFKAFSSRFPKIELPVVLAPDSHHDFAQHNQTLPLDWVAQILKPEGIDDEFTEFIPCFQLPKTKDFTGLVYWRAELMRYTYHLATFDKKGEIIDTRIIAGTISDDDLLLHSVATIDPEWTISIMEGSAEGHLSEKFDASSSRATFLEILPDGKIISSKGQSS